jgi:hypothetical protein
MDLKSICGEKRILKNGSLTSGRSFLFKLMPLNERANLIPDLVKRDKRDLF